MVGDIWKLPCAPSCGVLHGRRGPERPPDLGTSASVSTATDCMDSFNKNPVCVCVCVHACWMYCVLYLYVESYLHAV